MTREALVELVRRVMAAEGTDAEIVRWAAEVSRHVPHPGWTELIYHPDSDPEATAESVVDAALAYQPIRL